MNNYIWKSFVFFNLFLLFSVSFANDTVTVALDEWPPFVSKDLKHYGLISRVVKESFELAGYNVDFKFVPWKRAYIDTSLGIYDASPGWALTEERKKDVIFSDLISQTDHVFFHKKSFDFTWDNLEDLKGLTVGTTLGSYYGKDFAKAIEDGIFKIEVAATDALNFKKLAKERIDLFICLDLTGIYTARKTLSKDEFNSITYIPKAVSIKTPDSGGHVIFPINSRGEQLRDDFNKGLKKLKNNGKYNQYFEESKKGLYELSK